MAVEVGDLIEITGDALGDTPRSGEIVEALGEPGHEHFGVRWEDGHESISFPAKDAVIRHHRPDSGLPLRADVPARSLS